jgi:hypothetical protein
MTIKAALLSAIMILLSFAIIPHAYKHPVDYYADDANYFDHYPSCYPSSYYFNGRTYVVYHGQSPARSKTGDPYILYYDHMTRKWSETYKVGTNLLVDDFHGAPCLWIDVEGYIHVLYGSHGSLTPLRHAKSIVPESISLGFSLQPSLGSAYNLTYPRVCYDSLADVVHPIYRWYDGNNIFEWRYVNSTDNGFTWSQQTTIIATDDGTGSYPYMQGASGLDPFSKDRIHLGWSIFNESEGFDEHINPSEDIFYGYLNLTDMHMYNVEGMNLGASIDSEREMVDYTKIWDSGDRGTCGAIVHVDSNHTPYLMWTTENTTASGYGTHYYTSWNGTSWNPLRQIGHADRYSSVGDFIVRSSSDIVAFMTLVKDIYRYSWNGSSWTLEENIYTSTRGRSLAFASVTCPYNIEPHDEFQITFCEWYNADDNRAYAWGSNGIIQVI